MSATIACGGCGPHHDAPAAADATPRAAPMPDAAQAVWQFPLEDDADDLSAFLLDGWLPRAGTERFVWIGDVASVGLSVRRAGGFAAMLEGFANGRPRRLRASIDAQPIGPPDIIETTSSVTILPIGTLSAGEHQLRLESLDESEARSPADPRRVSVAVARLTITRVGG